jgi:serine/threonine protein phosphatase PrpC
LFLFLLSLSSSDEYPFLILACDGVWDVMTDQEAVDMVLRLPLHEQPRAAEVVVKEAMKRETCDNITCVVVFFD